MTIDKKTIEHLERLARITLRDDEVEPLTRELDRIVRFVEKLQSVDTAGVETAKLAPQAVVARLRTDEAQAGLERDRVLEQAPDAMKGCFRVPRVIERHDEH